MGTMVNPIQNQPQISLMPAPECAASAASLSPWIAVSERLPEPEVDVLFYMPAYRCLLLGSFRRASDYVTTDHFLLPNCEIWPLSKVSHWTSLPALPEHR